LNIIQNSLEAMPQGGKITISSASVEQNKEVAITIQDTGVGIPPDMIDKAREPFFSTRKKEGLRGLGLAIVHDILKTHGGKMEIKSPPGEGTAVILYLPLTDKPEHNT
jgi:two-component system sensor histidine kinase AtoS